MSHQSDPSTLRREFENERKVLGDRIAEVDRILGAFRILEEGGVSFAPTNGARRESDIVSEIRALLPSFCGNPFGMRDVGEMLADQPSRMTLRNALNALVEGGTLNITRQGSRGVATQYQVGHIVLEERSLPMNELGIHEIGQRDGAGLKTGP